jgi:glutaredoxin
MREDYLIFSEDYFFQCSHAMAIRIPCPYCLRVKATLKNPRINKNDFIFQYGEM